MTLEDKDGSLLISPEESDHGSPGEFGTCQGEKPMVHPTADAPICESCQKEDLQFFNPECSGCQTLLTDHATTVSQIFAILRQWTPQTQQSLEILFREILRRGGQVNDRDSLTDMTLLHYASKAAAVGMGDVDEICRMLHLLLAEGADLYVRCRWTNMTALHYATYFNVAPAVRILLEASQGVDIDSRCAEFDHGSPLHIAAASLAYDSAKVLLEYEADPLSKDSSGRTPMDCVPSADACELETGQLVTKMRHLLEEAKSHADEAAALKQEDEEIQTSLRVLGVKLGEKVLVGGIKTGILRFCGRTKFADGIWAGIELEEQAGKNNGCVGGVTYFTCPPMYGIFAPLSKIAKPGILVNAVKGMTAHHNQPLTPGKVNTMHVTAKVDTGRPSKSKNNGVGTILTGDLDVGDRVLVAGQRKGIIRFSGVTDFAPGWWYGIELDRPVGKNDGCVNEKKYFTCKEKHGVFAPPSRIQRISDLHGSSDSLNSVSASAAEKQRRLSVGSTDSVNSSPKKSTQSRPKSSGSLGLRRTFATPGMGELRLQEGMSVFCNNELGVLRYIGPVEFTDGIWLGVELRTPRGKNDGSVQGKRYFHCKPNHGLVVRPSKVTVRGINGARLLGDAYTNAEK